MTEEKIETEKENYTEPEQKKSGAIVKFDHVTKIYKGDFSALADINLEIKEGEFVSVVGHSGAGKSTLLKLIYAEEMPTEGEVYFDGQPIRKIARRKLPLKMWLLLWKFAERLSVRFWKMCRKFWISWDWEIRWKNSPISSPEENNRKWYWPEP